ncbi:MAG: hypothetical protein WC205_19035 [Opitutaceae bacterium]|jgi:hypothetical protein
MKSKLIWMMLFSLPTLAGGYMTWSMWRIHDDGLWLFLVFTAFFLALMLVPCLPKSRKQKEGEQVPSTRFAGAWVLPFYLLLFGAMLVIGLLGYFFAPGK